MKFLQHCGECPELEYIKGKENVGFCPVVGHDRHIKRELCDDIWEKEVKRLALLGGLSGKKTWDILKVDKALDPKRAIEAAGGSWPKAETKKEKKEPVKGKKKA